MSLRLKPVLAGFPCFSFFKLECEHFRISFTKRTWLFSICTTHHWRSHGEHWRHAPLPGAYFVTQNSAKNAPKHVIFTHTTC